MNVNILVGIQLALLISVVGGLLHQYAEPIVRDNEEFDFIIVGASPTGSVIANRLSENRDWKVLLIEAGEEPKFLLNIPAITGIWQFTDYGWQYSTEPNNQSCFVCPGKIMGWRRGKGLGGSSIINFMIAVRGNKIDYDRWAAMGNPGWSYDEVLPYFMKSEDIRVERIDPEYHQKGGYLTISDVPYRSESAAAYVRAAQEAGHSYVDYNGKEQLGVSFVHSTTRDGSRDSAETAFLRPIRFRRNLKILKNSRVVQILIDPLTKEAYGVKYSRNMKYYTALAKKEIIVSAGGLNSPQLLMLSGVGPKDDLEKLGIPLIYDSPVGRKLYDHLAFIGMIYKFNESIALNFDTALLRLPEYILRKQGIITSIGGVEAMTYVKTNASRDLDPLPDAELFFVGTALNGDRGIAFKRMFNIPDDVYNKVWAPLELGKVCQVMIMPTHPESVGYMKLASSNPFTWPKFYPNYLSDPGDHDVKTFLAAIREVQRIMSAPSMKRYDATQVTTPIPGCEAHVFDSDDYWTCAIRFVSSTLWHQVSTCKMGPANDSEAIVDHELRVYGVKNLRVADTSVIPLTITAHTVLASYMIGEKAADLLKKSWQDTDNQISTKDVRSIEDILV